ncbi:MAG TPA: cyclodeaminase/cyclohydrolase family protein [Candidatus Tyrphobacter sp.]
MEYLARLASANPTPGGGSAATVVAAMGAALIEMAARITTSNPKYEAVRESAQRLIGRAGALRAELGEAQARDEAAFAAVMATRGAERQAAWARAAAEPLNAMRLALEVQRLSVEALSLENSHLASDIGCAAEFAAAAVAACAYNVRINHRALRDAGIVAGQAAEMERYEHESATLLRRVRETAR